MASRLQQAAIKALPKLPSSLANMVLPRILPAPAGADPKMRAGIEEGNGNSPIYAADEQDWNNPDYTPQLLGHEMYHDKVNNLPPKLRNMMPPVDANDPYNKNGRLANLKRVNGDPLKLSNEEGAADMQEMIADRQSGKKMDPIYDTFDRKFAALPLSVMQPTDPNQKGINTMARDPGLPTGYSMATGRILQAQDIKPVKPGSGNQQEAPDFIPDSSADTPDFIPDTTQQPTPQDAPTQPLMARIDGFVNRELAPNDTGNHPIENTLLGIGHGIYSAIRHPLDTFMSGASSGNYPGMVYTGDKAVDQANAENPSTASLVQNASASMAAAKKNPAYTVGSIIGPLALTAGIAKGIDIAPEAGRAIRTKMIGDPDVAALRGLRVPTSSPKTLSTLKSVEGARPYLKGANSLQDLQVRVPQAKAEIWQPYQETIDAIGDNPVKGPDGMTTIRDLENERLQTSALLRDLKARSPEAIQQAQQKGLSQADLLDRERAIKAALDPHLERAGLNPQEIRARFGNVAQIGSKISGKSTLAEQPQPYGFGKMLDLQLDNPRSWLGSPMQGVRDLAAGRPLWRGKPTDISLREGFRMAGPKPNLGNYSEFSPKGLLNAPEPEFEHIPLGPVPNEMIESPMQIVRASRMSNGNIVGGSPDPFNLEQLGNRATLPPARMTRRAFVTGTDEPINDLQRSGPGVLIRKKLPQK